MKSIQIDLEAAAKAVAARLAASLAPDDVRARQDLRDVLDADLSVQDFIAYVTVLAQANAYVAASLGAVKVREVLGGSAAPKTVSRKASPRAPKSARPPVDLVLGALREAKCNLPKAEILARVAAQNPDLSKAQLGNLWTNARASLASEGSGPKTRYGLR